MQHRKLDHRVTPSQGLSRIPGVGCPQKPEAQGILSPQHDPTEQVVCRLGDRSCATAHAATLDRSTASLPSRGGQSLLQLQKQYGNRYVQQVLALSREGGSETDAG